GVPAGRDDDRAAADRLQRQRPRPTQRPEEAEAPLAKLPVHVRAPPSTTCKLVRRHPAKISAAGTGRENQNPWPRVQPRSARKFHSLSVSMPSASEVIPRFEAREIMAETMLAFCGSVSTSRTKIRSIFRTSTGMCRSRASDEY